MREQLRLWTSSVTISFRLPRVTPPPCAVSPLPTKPSSCPSSAPYRNQEGYLSARIVEKAAADTQLNSNPCLLSPSPLPYVACTCTWCFIVLHPSYRALPPLYYPSLLSPSLSLLPLSGCSSMTPIPLYTPTAGRRSCPQLDIFSADDLGLASNSRFICWCMFWTRTWIYTRVASLVIHPCPSSPCSALPSPVLTHHFFLGVPSRASVCRVLSVIIYC